MRLLPAFLTTVLALLAPLAAQSDCGSATGGRPRVGLVLSGGGSRSLAHIGVLEVLEREGVRVDCVAGTSMGAAIGALWASGYSAAEIETLVHSIDWQEVFSGRRVRPLIPLALRLDDVPPVLRIGFEGVKPRLPASTASDYRLNRLLIKHLTLPGLATGGDFDRLWRPFRAVATDLATGEPVVLERGSLARAVRASMSTPLTLPVVSIDGRTFTDGGLVDNTPVDVARAMGAEIVIVSETEAPPLRPEEYRDVYGVGEQVVDALRRLRPTASVREGDIIIEPDLGRRESEDYSRAEELIALGRVAAESVAPRLRGLPRWTGERAPITEAPRSVTVVEVTGASRLEQGAVRAAFGIETGDALDIEGIAHGLDRVWAMGLFETVWIDAWPAEGGVRLVVDVRETPHRYLELGVTADEQDQIGSFVRFRDRNVLGRGERLDLELLAGINERGVRTRLIVAGFGRRPVGFHLNGQWLTQEPVFFVAGEDVGRARFIRTVGGGGVHLGFGTDLLMQVGLMGGRVEAEPRPGVPIRSGTDAYRMLTGAVAWDRLDQWDVPESGFALVGGAERSLTGLGADRDYWRAWGTARAVVGLGARFVLEAKAFGGLSGRDVPVYDLFRLGGPKFLPGRPRAELWNRQALAGWIAPSIDIRGFRVSAYGGAGNAWESRESISLSDLRHGIGLGITRASRLGLLALVAGIDDDGHTAFYFSVGRRD